MLQPQVEAEETAAVREAEGPGATTPGPDFGDTGIPAADPAPEPLPEPPARALAARIRRAFDVTAALVGLLIFLPLLAAIALAVRIDTPGPVFYSHIRLGRDGRHFLLYKFRKFAHGAPPGISVTLKDDARMTRVGRFIERVKLDELPQLWNVLVGDMSIVGPRPETIDFADCFRGRYRAVLDHKPGLFGPNQAIFRHENSLYPDDRDPHEFYRAVLFPAKAAIDLAYFPQRTFRRDISWIIRAGLAIFGLPSKAAWFRAGISPPERLLSPASQMVGSPDDERSFDVVI